MPLRASNTYAITVLFSILMIPSCFITFHKYVKINLSLWELLGHSMGLMNSDLYFNSWTVGIIYMGSRNKR